MQRDKEIDDFINENDIEVDMGEPVRSSLENTRPMIPNSGTED